jgi:Cu/Zn superoxide dismutase
MQLKAGQFYFNIHTAMFGGGEVRGQIMPAPAQKFVGSLDAAQEVPTNSSTATGAGTVLLNATEDQIIVNLNFTGLTSNAIAAHIHGPAGPGTNAGIVFDLSSGLPIATSGTVTEQTFAINATQAGQLKAGLFYFNIHSSNFSGGEIRGQILFPPTQKFSGTLAAWQEVPPNPNTGTGTGTVVLSAAEDRIAVNLTYSGLTGAPIAGHIHGPAAAGGNAGILFDFSSSLPAAASGSIPQRTFTITPDQVTQLEAGQFYFNLHTGAFSGGEIRGQILPVPVQKFTATFSGAQEDPPNMSSGTGAGTVLLNPTDDQITANLTFSGLSSSAIAAHIHGPAPAGSSAGIVFGFSGIPSAMSGLIPEQTFAITPSQVSDLRSFLHYFNVHSINFNNGEIRGQVLPIPKLTLTKAGNAPSNGTVTSSPAGVICGGDCSEAYDSGTVVTLTSTIPPSGSFFAGWSGGGCSGTDPCALTLAADTTVTATYSATAYTFTDDPLAAGSTAVKAAHIIELRAAVNTLRANNGLPAFAFTDPTITAGTTEIRAVHITELRTALNAVYVQRGLTPPTYTDPTITAGAFTVKRVHVAELRTAARALE